MSLRTTIERAMLDASKCEPIDGGLCLDCLERAGLVRMAVTQYLLEEMKLALASAGSELEREALRGFWHRINRVGEMGNRSKEQRMNA